MLYSVLVNIDQHKKVINNFCKVFSNLNWTEIVFSFLSILDHFHAIKKIVKKQLSSGGGTQTLVVRPLNKNVCLSLLFD